MAAAIIMSMRLTSDVPLAPASKGERLRAWAIIAACCAGLCLLTAGMFHAGWPYKTHLLAALGLGGLLYLPFSTSSESDEDDSPVPILDKVKVTLRFRGREMAHQEIGMRQIERIKTDLQEYAAVEQMPKMEGRQMVMILAPVKKK